MNTPETQSAARSSEGLGHVPPRGTNSRAYKDGINTELRETLSAMKVGEESEWPIKCENTVRVIARRLGIKAVSRRLGRTDKITVYRVA